MKIFTALTSKEHASHVNSEDDRVVFRHPKVNNCDECIQVAKEAVRLGQWKDEQAKHAWTLVRLSSERLGLGFRSVLESDFGDGHTMLEKCIEAEDW